MGALIERAIRSASEALINQDVEAANKAIAFDREVDRKERDIEMLCLKLLLQQQPVARDLRQISSALLSLIHIFPCICSEQSLGMPVSYTHLDVYKRQG